MIVYILIIILLLAMLFFFSSLKISWQLYSGEKNEDIQAENSILSLLVAKYLCEIAFIVLSILLIWDNLPVIYLVMIILMIILLVAEIIPVYLAGKITWKLVMISSSLVKILFVIFYPAVIIIKKFSEKHGLIQNIYGQDIFPISLKENKNLYKKKLGTIVTDKSENDLLTNIVELSDRRIYEAMRPRTEIVGVEINSSVEEILDVFIKSGYSKIPVYEDNLDNIKGIVFANDFFHSPAGISSVIRDVIFVPETKKCSDMLREFSEKRISFAVAVDEFGGTAGILTMEDILEELFGEIKDEYDTEDILCRKIADNTYIIGGKVEIDYINETLDLKIPQGDYSTIGGYITHHIGSIPDKGENIQIDKFKINILRSNQMRIELVKVSVFP